MDRHLTALVSGGNEHLGSIAVALNRAGVRVVLHAHNAQESRAASLVAASSPGHVDLIDVPIDSFEDADHLVARVADAHGGLDILLTPPVPATAHRLVELDEHDWHVVLAAYQKRAVALARAAARRFVAQGHGGRIVTFSSETAFSSPSFAAAALDASMLSLASAISGPLAPHDVTANCVVLGGGLGPVPHLATERSMVSELVAQLCGPEAQGVTGRFLYASREDIGVYSMPLAMENPHAMVRFSTDTPADAVTTFLTPLLAIGKA